MAVATREEEVRAWLALTLVPGVSLRTQHALLKALGSPLAVAAAPFSQLAQVAGPEAAGALKRGPRPGLLEGTMRWLEGPDRHLVAAGDDRYPQALLHIGDPPHVLYVQGRTELLNAPSLAIVGSRNATPHGAQDAQELARALSDAGLAIVSGLALGIDAAAHRGGLAGASSSLAIMGTGPNVLYPRRNQPLARELAQRGCLVSEFPLDTPAAAGNFPRRNRLISGISRGVLVVEAALKSGSLITAQCALDQGRDVFAVPGSVHSPLSKGSHSLIKGGAVLVEGVDDVLRELDMAPTGQTQAACTRGGDLVLDALGFAPASLDELAMRTQLGAATLAARLTRLELEGSVDSLPGGRFQRAREH